jgi:hypothetical protein
MERRRSKRIVVTLEAEIISSAKSYPGFLETDTELPDVSVYTYAGIIENISEDGMLFSVSEITNVNFDIGERLEIAFQLPSGERLNLHCMVRRFQDGITPQDLTQRLGMLIIDPPPAFSKFINATLNQRN